MSLREELNTALEPYGATCTDVDKTEVIHGEAVTKITILLDDAKNMFITFAAKLKLTHEDMVDLVTKKVASYNGGKTE